MESINKSTINKVDGSFKKNTHPCPLYSCLSNESSKHKKGSQISEKENRDDSSLGTDPKPNLTEKNCQIDSHEE